ncbi:hypothetical protein SDC9_105085 [bioreactor metagenome]|uniref:Uncharacterized protein n=1 Tax=bioreactor metagenome TaxID=1076179 RepID=A0A645B9A4_9ZZZZ
MTVILPIKKEYIPKTSADNAGETSVNTYISYVRMPTPVLLSQKVSNACCQKNTHAKYESIHADRKVSNMKKILMHNAS